MSREMRMPSIAYIVARSWPDGVIGRNNDLPWRIPSDLRRFKEITSGHAILMGRKTFDSIGRPLPNRMNIVLSSQPGNDGPNLAWTDRIENAMYIADIFSILNEKNEFFIIGGSKMYELFGDFVNKVYLTEVLANIDGDARFDMKFPPNKWRSVEESSFQEENDEHRYNFSILERKIKVTRQRDISEFLQEDDRTVDFIDNYLNEVKPKVSGMEFRLKRRISSINKLTETLERYRAKDR
ncbi:dihydrofolate reductase [Bosea sp. LjRoot90]|uniref:dihydrofolate reductase n=1 Tax=Bosea sp. LjRoot90 TaxID=3342342 RepID=UPI003F4FA433